MNIKQEVETRLNDILGMPLTRTGRSANLVWFGFGKIIDVVDFHGNKGKAAQYSLNIQCCWRVVKDEKILVASGDMYVAGANWREEEFYWDTKGMNLCDDGLKKLISTTNKSLFVQSIQADNLGGLHICFSDNYTLEIFADYSYTEEYWRFFNRESKSPHLVITNEGIELDDDID